MKTHMNNTISANLANDIVSQTMFNNHQQYVNSNQIKPKVVTKRKQQIKIVKNNKVQLNTNPNQHVNHLFKKLYNTSNPNTTEKNFNNNKNQSRLSHANTTNYNFKSTLDNKQPQSFKLSQTILKDKIKRNKHQKFHLKQHQRQYQHLQNRIQNCKSINQRKKNNWDPIVNPVYLMKGNKLEAQKSTIKPYCEKILGMNRPKSAIQSGGGRHKENNNMNMVSNTNYQSYLNIQQPQNAYYQSSVPDYSNQNPKKVTSKQLNNKSKRPATAGNNKNSHKKASSNHHQNNRNTSDLPEPSYNGLLKYILQNKVYKDTDLKVLYVRLCYLYGEENIDDVWEQVMDQLQR